MSASLSYYFARSKRERERKSAEVCTKPTLLNGKYLCTRFLYLGYLIFVFGFNNERDRKI